MGSKKKTSIDIIALQCTEKTAKIFRESLRRTSIAHSAARKSCTRKQKQNKLVRLLLDRGSLI